MDRAWRVVVPLRLSDAKSRLSTHTAPQRRALVIAMARDVVAAARECPLVAEVRLVTDGDGRLAMGEGIDVVADPGAGLNDAVLAAAVGSPGPVAALLADVPCSTPDALAIALAECLEQPGFLPDAEGIGTTLLAAPSVAELTPRFGSRSRAAHAAAGIREIRDPAGSVLAGLRRDVDSEVDLWDARRMGVGPFTRATLS
jgi:2-phospho-L-lactate/phosphoenolpyruvate guanylyltransferase